MKKDTNIFENLTKSQRLCSAVEKAKKYPHFLHFDQFPLLTPVKFWLSQRAAHGKGKTKNISPLSPL